MGGLQKPGKTLQKCKLIQTRNSSGKIFSISEPLIRYPAFCCQEEFDQRVASSENMCFFPGKKQTGRVIECGLRGAAGR